MIHSNHRSTTLSNRTLGMLVRVEVSAEGSPPAVAAAVLSSASARSPRLAAGWYPYRLFAPFGSPARDSDPDVDVDVDVDANADESIPLPMMGNEREPSLLSKRINCVRVRFRLGFELLEEMGEEASEEDAKFGENAPVEK